MHDQQQVALRFLVHLDFFTGGVVALQAGVDGLGLQVEAVVGLAALAQGVVVPGCSGGVLVVVVEEKAFFGC